MPNTLLNKDGETWCPSCGTVFADDGKTVAREGRSKHGASCPDAGHDRFGNIRFGKFLKDAPTHEEVA